MKKTLKRRTFISAIAMLIVSAIVLTSSTFAWFSMARDVSVEKMELTVTSPDGIQISANTKNWTTQLSVSDLNPTEETVSRFKADEDHTNHFPTQLVPSSSALSTTGGTLPAFIQGSVDQNGTITMKTVSDSNGGYVVFDVFLKVAEAQPVYWNDTTVTVVENGNEEILCATRAVVLPLGASEDPAVAKTVKSCVQGDAQMFEPAAKKHLAELVDAGKATNGVAVETNYMIRPVNSTISSNNYVYPGGSTYYATLTNAKVQANEDDKSEMMFRAKKGINRVRVYLWIEGQDIDCQQSVGGSQLVFNLKFSLDA